MRDAVNFILSYIERHGDTEQSGKAAQHKFLLAEELTALDPAPDATGDHGDPSAEFKAAVNGVVFGKPEAEAK